MSEVNNTSDKVNVKEQVKALQTTKRVRRKRYSSGEKFSVDEQFVEWFVLETDESNIEELSRAFTKKVSRTALKIFEPKMDGSSENNDLRVAIDEFALFLNSLDPRTTKRVREYLRLQHISLEPQMGVGFSVDVNHKVPVAENLASGLASMMNNFTLAKDGALSSINQDGMTAWIFIMVFIFFVSVGYSKCLDMMPSNYKKVVSYLTPILLLSGILGPQLEQCLRAFANKASDDTVRVTDALSKMKKLDEEIFHVSISDDEISALYREEYEEAKEEYIYDVINEFLVEQPKTVHYGSLNPDEAFIHYNIKNSMSGNAHTVYATQADWLESSDGELYKAAKADYDRRVENRHKGRYRNMKAAQEIYMEELNALSPQMETESIVDVAGLLYAALSYRIFGFKTPDSALKVITSFWHARPALEDGIVKILSLLQDITDIYISEYTDYKPYKFLKMRSEKYKRFQERCDDIIHTYNKDKLYPTNENYIKVKSLVTEMKVEYCSLSRDKNMRGETVIFKKELNKIEDICSKLMKLVGNKQAFRVEPTVIFLRGSPGVAKSISSDFMAVDCVRMAVLYRLHKNGLTVGDLLQDDMYKRIKEDPSSFIYHRFPNEFWDSYSIETLVTIMDDFDQDKDLAGKTNSSFLELICAGSSAKFPLNMAHLEEKGNIDFKSHFIIGNTNTLSFKPESIRNPEALNRRINLSLFVSPRSIYCTDATKNASPDSRRLDKSKLPKYYGTHGEATKLNPAMQDFFITDYKGKFIDNVAYSYDQILEKIFYIYKMKLLWNESFVEEITHRTSRHEFDKQAAARKKKIEITINPIVSKEWLTISSKFKVPLESQMEEEIREISKLADKVMQQMPCNYTNATPQDEGEEYFECLEERAENEFIDKASDQLQEWLLISIGYRGDKCRELFYVNSIKELYVRSFRKPHPSSNVVALAKLYECYGETLVNEHLMFVYDFQEQLGLPEIEIERERAISVWNIDFEQWLNKAFIKAKEIMKAGVQVLNRIISYVDGEAFRAIVSVLSTLGLAYVGYKMFTSKDDEELQPQSFNIGDKLAKNNPKEKWVGKNFKSVIPKHHAQAQMAHHKDPSGGQLIQSIIKKNLFVVKYEQKQGTGVYLKAGICVALGGRKVLMHYHFITRMMAKIRADADYLNARIVFAAGDAHQYQRIFMLVDIVRNLSEHCQIPGKDLCIFELPESFQPRTNIISRFAKMSDFKTFKKNLDFVLIMNDQGYMKFHTGKAQAMDEEKPVSSSWSETWYIRNGYMYEAMTEKGDCGSLLCLMNANVPLRKIFGIHTAFEASSGFGFSESICQEEIEACLEKIGTIIDYPEIEELPYAVPQLGAMAESPQFNVIAELAPHQIPGKILETDLRKSVIFDKVSTHTCLPAVLKPCVRNGEIKCPMELAKKKMCIRPTGVHQFIVDQLEDSLYSFLMNNSPYSVEKKILEPYEILFGMEDNSLVRKIKSSSSSGYPESLKPKHMRFKDRIFRTEEGTVERNDVVNEYLEHINPIEDKLRSNIRPVFLWTAKSKDEKRPIEKVLNVSTRMFQCGPFDLLYLTKKYFGSFVAWCTLNRIHNSFTGGINVYSSEWHTLYQKMARFGEDLRNKGAGDFAKYDGSQLTPFHYACLHIINRWYNDEFSNIRSILFLELCNARVIFDQYIVELSHGLTSGHFLTFLINCMMNQLYHRGCWLSMGYKLFLFDSNVVLFVHGDDSVFAVNPKFAENFNESGLEKYMMTFGMEYTSESKGEVSVALRHISEVNYLKRTWVYSDLLGRTIGPMSLDAVLEPLNWTSKDNGFDITCTNIDGCLRELALHKQSVFEEYRTKIVNVVSKYMYGAVFTRSLHMPYLDWLDIVCESEGYV